MQSAPLLGTELSKPTSGQQPRTFLERGAAVPYTTPDLSAARLRPDGRNGLELIVPNPFGARGVYVVGLADIQALCSPTLHDRAINKMLADLRSVSPGVIRRTAREVAIGGLAGRDAADRAAADLAWDQQQVLTARFESLLEVLRQLELRGAGWQPPEQSAYDDLGRRARGVLQRLVLQFSRPADTLMNSLVEIATLFAEVGIGRQAGAARLPARLAAIEDLAGQMRRVRQAAGAAGNPDAAYVEAAALVTAAAVRKTLTETRGLLDDMTRLLEQWLTAPDALARRVARPEWLLDGWEHICLLWRAAGKPAGEAATLVEMVALVPATPREASEWVGAGIFGTGMFGTGETQRPHRSAALGQDQRAGITYTDLVARNERLRAMAFGGAT